MDALGIALIVIGLALVCAGLVFWRWASRTQPADLDGDGPGELRGLIDALDQAESSARSVRPRLDQIRREDSSK